MKWYKLKRNISRKEAKLILKYMREIIDEYGFVTLADFYDLIDVRNVAYTDVQKVWCSLSGARVSLIRIKGNYRIKLPDFVEMSLVDQYDFISNNDKKGSV